MSLTDECFCDGNGSVSCDACMGEGLVTEASDDLEDMQLVCDECHGLGIFLCLTHNAQAGEGESDG